MEENEIYIFRDGFYLPVEVPCDTCIGCDFDDDRYSDTGLCVADVECFNRRIKSGKYLIWKLHKDFCRKN